MAPQGYVPSLGDEGEGEIDWLEGSERDDGDNGEGGGGNMNGRNYVGNENGLGAIGNGNTGNGPIPFHPQVPNSYLSTTNPPTTTSTSRSTIKTNPSSANAVTSSSISDTTTTSPTSTYMSSSTTTTLRSQTMVSESLASSILPSTPTSTSTSTTTPTSLPNTGAGSQSTGLTPHPSTISTHHALSGASIAGIVIGTLAALTFILATLWHILRRKKKNKDHRKSIGGFGFANWNDTGTDTRTEKDTEQVETIVPPYDGRIRPGMGVQRVLTWSTMRSLTHSRISSQVSQNPSTSSQHTLRNPFAEQNCSIPGLENGNLGNEPDKRTLDENEAGAHEDIVEFGDSIDWIRNRDRRRDRDRGGLPVSGTGAGSMDWRYSVRINGGGNNL
ncbi:hypothetical protein SBOR_3815 [Sclerotinia borealis F-4128]|uniref:Uncharacterized protein n=1 Tax=Sclerotinia borealis (strain F-4128) TaxID=1432307 RepID=W9CIK1_SCLBF|nr:hypothetical protein SBOR_3815 [Sclerotinia borealis F-4128]